MAAEQEGKEEGNEVKQGIAAQHLTIGTTIDDIPPAVLGPAIAPSIQPESGPPSHRKRGSHGQGLGKLGGGVNLPQGQEAGPSGKGGKRRSQVGRGRQFKHHRDQKLAR